MSAYKDWWGAVRNGLVNHPRAKHIDQMGQAICLFLHFICAVDSKTGRVEDTSYKKISKMMGKNVSTIKRWRKILVTHEYIKVTRHSYGFAVQIKNWRPVSNGAKKKAQKGGKSPETDHPSKGSNMTYQGGVEYDLSQASREVISNTKTIPIWPITEKNSDNNGHKNNNLETETNILKEVKEVDLLSKEEGSSLIGVPPEGSAAAMKGGDDGWFN